MIYWNLIKILIEAQFKDEIIKTVFACGISNLTAKDSEHYSSNGETLIQCVEIEFYVDVADIESSINKIKQRSVGIKKNFVVIPVSRY